MQILLLFTPPRKLRNIQYLKISHHINKLA
jgi:hypothetical protein